MATELSRHPVMHLERSSIKPRESKLCRELRIAGIHPFTSKSVREYKDAMLVRSRPSWLVRKVFAPINRLLFCERGATPFEDKVIVDRQISASLFPGLGFLILSFVYLAYGHWLAAILNLPLCFLPCIIIQKLNDWYIDAYSQFGWEYQYFHSSFEEDIKKFEVPEFVLDTAAEIKMRLPDVFLYLCVFKCTRVADPFLVVLDPQTKRYLHVEVWGEPCFKGQRVA